MSVSKNFESWRYGMFVHYGLFSMLERGEWVMNRERRSPASMRELASRFDPSQFDANALCDLALAGGMKYVTLTTMHHEGFRLYDTELTDFNAKAVCGRDLVEEFVTAARERDLKICLYHSLNNWFDAPDASDALERPDAYDEFIANTFARLKELVERFQPFEVMWYDGWWPFNAERWKAEEMNATLRMICPGLLFNGRNGLDGDFGTPEGHMSAPSPWRPWEACMTLNNNWGYHRGDHEWKSEKEVIRLLTGASQGQGNLLLNIGPRGDGSIPERSEEIVRNVGAWLKKNGASIYETDRFSFGLMDRSGHNGDWSHNGTFTLSGNTMYHQILNWPGSEVVIAGVEAVLNHVALLTEHGEQACSFTQDGSVIQVTGLPENPPDPFAPVLRLDFDSTPSMELSGGMRIPQAAHPPYDPCPSDIAH